MKFRPAAAGFRFLLLSGWAALLLQGCGTTYSGTEGEISSATAGGPYRLAVGDPIVVVLRGIPQPMTTDDIVNERGEISLPYINEIKVVGMTSSELEEYIHGLYVPHYFREASVNVLIPSERTYFLYGEIRGPGRYQYTGGITILQAIAAAGGFTEFARPTRVELLRGDSKTRHNLLDIRKNPEKDIKLEPGDIIIVPRSIWG